MLNACDSCLGGLIGDYGLHAALWFRIKCTTCQHFKALWEGSNMHV